MVMTGEMPRLGGENKSKTKEEKRTFRFEVIFSEPTKNQYTELNWKEMVKKQERDELVEDDEDEEIKVITQRLMQKYGTENNGHKKKAAVAVRKVAGDEEDDYDFEDPFIDDSEIIDEVVPEEVTTVHGGFYINKGSLEFKNTEIIIDEEEKAFKQPVITAIDPEVKRKPSSVIETPTTPAFKNPNKSSSEKKVSTPGDNKARENSQIWKMIEKQTVKSKEKQGKVQPSPMKFYDLTSPDKNTPQKNSTPSKSATDGALTISRIKG